MKVAFQVLVNPASYKVETNIIKDSMKQLDPRFHNNQLIWSTVEQGGTILQGLMVAAAI